MAALCLAGLPLVGQVERFQRRNLLQVLSSGGGDLEGEGGREILYRFDTKGKSGSATPTSDNSGSNTTASATTASDSNATSSSQSSSQDSGQT